VTARPLDFAPAAWQAYRGLPAGELAGQVKLALEWLAADPVAVRADPRSRRHQILEERLPQAAQVWGLPVEVPNGGRWLVVWREVPNVIEIGYIGPAPPTTIDAVPITEATPGPSSVSNGSTGR
jgi:hypothetical protein